MAKGFATSRGKPSEKSPESEAPTFFPITIDDLKPDPQNPRVISEEAQGGLGFALHEFGDLGGITWNRRTGLLITGHKRLIGLLERHGPKNLMVNQTHGDNFAVVTPDGESHKGRVVDWPEPRAKAAMLAANSPTIQGQFTKGVGTILDRLKSDAPGLLRPLMLDRLRKIAIGTIDENGSVGDPEREDQGPRESETVIVKPGDLWICGEHRVLCGDASDKDERRRCGADDWMLLLTDPPYGINYDPQAMFMYGANHPPPKASGPMQGDDGSLDLSWLAGYPRRIIWGFPLIQVGGETGWLVWDKHPGLTGESIGNPVEMAGSTCWTGFKIVRVLWAGYYKAAGEERGIHPTQKPVSVISPWIELYTERGNPVLDFFLGSGTTMIAAERLGRRCFGIEIDPRYVQVAIQRWADLTGSDPVREDGMSFQSLVDEK